MKYRVWDKQYKYMDHEPGSELLLRHDGTLLEKYDYQYAGQTYDDYGVTNQYILMLSSGLKDKNDKEIFEGDIVLIDWGFNGDHEYKAGKYAVIFDEGSWLIDTGGNYRVPSELIDHTLNRRCEVVGHIYENPSGN